MIFEINSVTARDGQHEAFEAAFAEAGALLRRIRGCRSARLLRCVEQPGRYQIEIGWDRLEDHVEHYPATEEAAQVRARLLPLVESADPAHYEVVAAS